MHTKLVYIYSYEHYQGIKQVLIYKVIVTWAHAVLLYFACEPCLQQLSHLCSPRAVPLNQGVGSASAVWHVCEGVY